VDLENGGSHEINVADAPRIQTAKNKEKVEFDFRIVQKLTTKKCTAITALKVCNV
jgi:hypothetical protein